MHDKGFLIIHIICKMNYFLEMFFYEAIIIYIKILTIKIRQIESYQRKKYYLSEI